MQVTSLLVKEGIHKALLGIEKNENTLRGELIGV